MEGLLERKWYSHLIDKTIQTRIHHFRGPAKMVQSLYHPAGCIWDGIASTVGVEPMHYSWKQYASVNNTPN